ncbi:MAG: hypothetical protein WC966_06445 [Bradymonadales bacterium]|jgi:hypothetical protein
MKKWIVEALGLRITVTLVFILIGVLLQIFGDQYEIIGYEQPKFSSMSRIQFYGNIIVFFALIINNYARKERVKFAASEQQWVNANLSSYHKLMEKTRNVKEQSSRGSYLVLYLIFTLVYYLVVIGYFYPPEELKEISKNCYLVFSGISVLFVLFFHNKIYYYPYAILIKEDNFDAIVEYDYPENFRIIPQFGMRKLKSGDTIPTDVRFILDYKDKSEDWVSLMFTTNLNTVQKYSYSFTYAVFVAKANSQVFEDFKSYKAPKGWKLEAKKGEDYSTVAIVKGGYHTKHKDCQALVASLCQFIQLKFAQNEPKET